MTALNVAVVGLGVGEQHASGFVRAGCALRAVYDLDAAKATDVAKRVGQGVVAKSFEAILEDPAIDAIALATYDDCHAEEVVRALDAGKHVFCEKPLCRTPGELAKIEQAWKESGKHLASNLILRTAPLYRRVRDLIASGSFGDVYAFYGDYLYGRLSKITEGWRSGIDDYSVMQGGGVHLVDLMGFLTGAKPVSVRASGNRIATEGTKFRYLDFVTATFENDTRMTAVISANFASVHKHQHVVRIFGTKASFVYDDQGARIYRERDPGGPAEILHESPLPASKGDLIPDFLAGVANREKGDARTRFDLHVIRACMAADDALKTGSVVSVAGE